LTTARPCETNGSLSAALHLRVRPRRASLASLLGIAALVVTLTAAAPAWGATLTVTSTADVATNFGACGNSGQTVPTGTSLREAICAANNAGAASTTINVAAGTYTITSGELQMGKVSGSNITLNGAGSASTIIDGTHNSRVLDLDPSVVGGVTTSISGVTITNGRDGTFGGAGVIAGGGHSPQDHLTVSNSVFSNNQANFGAQTTSNKPGGGLSFQGGTLSLVNDTFSGNQSFSSAGGAVWYETFEAGGSLTVTGSTFSGNSTANSGLSGTSGGALGLAAGAGGATYSVSNSTFIGNTATSSGTGEAAAGGAIFEISGSLTVTGSTFTSNSVGGSGATGGPIIWTGGTTAMHYNRFVGNIGTGGVMTNSGSGTADVNENWWGCNTGPNTAGCETTSGTNITASPRLVLTATASPATMVGPNASSTITAALTQDSLGAAIAGANLGAFTGLPVGFSDPLPSGATLTAASANVSAGSASTSYNSQNTSGPGHVLATLDNGTSSATITVNRPPAITSANTATFTTGTAGSFTVTTTGYPAPAISRTGTVPAGLTFTDNGNGTATIAGTPTGTGGTYPVTLTANNGVAPNGTQNLTIQVNQPPSVTLNPGDQVVHPGDSVSFSAAASGVPTPTVQWQRSTDGGASFANIAGATSTTYTFTAALADSGNQYRAVFNNGVGSPATTTAATLSVGTAPSFTSADHTSFGVGQAGSFTITTSGAPSATLSRTGIQFPAWLTLTDNGDGSGSLTGTPPPGSSGTYQFTLKAANGISPSASQNFTLSVGDSPVITSADHTTFTSGSAGSFTVTTTAGFPTATTVVETGSLPSGVTFTDNGDGTATLAGTPAAGTGGTHPITITASNGVPPDAVQSFTLVVTALPSITSADQTTFQVGSAGSFTVTTNAGFPTATTLTETGSLPSGVSFTDNGDGTATLAGTPASGGGGSYPLTLRAANGAGHTDQSFTLTVVASPSITSADHVIFAVGSAGSFTVTTTAGVPAATTLTETGALPSGVSFTDNGDGTATLAGTPAAGTGGTHPISISASNGVPPGAVQSFTLVVTALPSITSADHSTFQVGSAGSFTVTTSAGFPVTTTLTETGSLPSGVSFTDDGDGTATLAGTPASGGGGSYPLTLRATNSAGHTDQSFTLTVVASPSITSADHVIFVVGSAGSFTVTTSPGVPAATTVTKVGALPSGVTFTDNGDGTATVAGTPAAGTGGTHPITITASNGVPPDAVQSFTLVVTAAPSITSADHATFQVGSAGSFTVTTSAGFPTATTVTETGSLPSGVSFTDNGDGTATLAGTPASGGGGNYPLTVRAANSVDHTDQSFTLTVVGSPSITSADHAIFAMGSAGSFTITTAAGFPAATTVTETGPLPSGVTFTDNGDGTATLAGTPAAGTAGGYPIKITASNGIPSDAFQNLALIVTALPSITSADHSTFQVGSAGSFTVTTSAGFPTATTLTETGSLPSGVSFTDNGDGTATLAGTPASGSGGSYPLTVRATNSAGHTDQSFTLTVVASPSITSADHTTFAVGSAGTFTVTTAPTATAVSETGALPSGVTFTDNGNGTATLAGTPAAGTGGSYSISVKASNGVPPDAVQSFTLIVTELPSITSANHATFLVGSPGSFSVTTHAGFPTATTLTETGSLPSGVSFTDNGDGTATLAGTPAAGSGGSYPLTLTATNTAGHTNQAFTLTVGASTTITSADHTTFTQGHAGTFTVTTAGGFPTPSALSETGALPNGVTFHDNGNGTATLAGTPTAGGIFALTIRANNGVAPAVTQSFTLTVNGPPVFASPNTATFLTGNNCGSYLLTTTAAGSPGPTHLTKSGTLPSGLTFHDNGDGSATISGCVNGLTSSRTFKLTITATNSVGSVTQAFTLFVQAPSTVPLPKKLPASNGVLLGIPALTARFQVVSISGSGFAPGAPITIGYYGGPVTVKTVYASSTGTFATTLTMSVGGSHTFVAAGTGGNGSSRFLEASSTTS
jgi:putative Ig domain-containing protein